MRRKWIPVVVLVLALGVVAQVSFADKGHSANSTVLRFKTMVGDQGPYVGPTNAIRGIPGAGSPWSIDQANGTLKQNGDLDVKVKGLIITGTGANPVPTFRAVVSCQSTANGAATVVNQVTAPFPATTSGDAQFRGKVQLPSPCVAPIVFVTTGTDPLAWFSVTGV
jgi:hypothetical protein